MTRCAHLVITRREYSLVALSSCHPVLLSACHLLQDRFDHAQQRGFRADLDEDRTAGRSQGFDAIDKAHRLTQVLPPVGGIGQFGGD